jgi:immune inhibitor A
VQKVQRAPERAVSKSFPTKGNMRGLVFLVEFPDKSFDKEHTKEMYTRMVNDSNYTDYGATGSASKYFSDQSMGQFVPTFDVVGPIKMPRPESLLRKEPL